MAVVKTISANGSKGHHKFSLRVSEDSTSGNSSFISYSFTIAPIQNGWDWYGFSIPYTITINGTNYTGNISSYNGSSTVTLKSGSNIEIAHNTDGTKTINMSFSVTDNTGKSYTCGYASASDTLALTDLHKAPTINTATMTETNALMISLGVPNTTIVPWLSQKTITLSATAYDSATLSYRLRHSMSDYYLPSSTTYQASATFNTDYRTNQVVVTNGKVGIVQYVVDNKGGASNDVVKVNINGTIQQPNGIPYAKPTLEETSTHIKRKSGNGTNLTDNKANINVKGLIYKGADVIGNYNSTTQVGYKIWQSGASEPGSYTNLTATTDSSGNVTVTNFEISNVDFTKAYNYKIILKDNYNYTYVVEGTIPLGQPTWSEYKDHVDFLSATIGGLSIVDAGTGYIKFYNGTMICYGSNTTGTLTWSQDGNRWCSANHTLPDFAETFISAPIVTKTIQSCNPSGRYICLTGSSSPTTTNPGSYNLDTYWNATNTIVTVSYIAIGKWK